jgi:predicted O-linked N-acetylglucosamine transferase (SPINDLY family)
MSRKQAPPIATPFPQHKPGGGLMRAFTGLFSRFGPRRAPQKTEPDDPRIRQALQRLQAGQPDKAEQACRQVLAVDPRNIEAHQLLARIALERGRSDLAIRLYSAAIAIAPQDPGLRQGLGGAYHAAGRLADAIRCLHEALALDPKAASAHINLGNCHTQLGQLAEAAASYRSAIASDPGDTAGYVSLANVLRQLGQADEAVKVARKALRIDADLPAAHLALAMALLQLDKWEESVAILEKLKARRPDDPEICHELGLALSKLGRTDEALANFREAVTRKPDFALAHNSLGAELLTRNDLEGAIACFRKVLALKPDFARVHSNLLLAMNYQAGSTQKKIYEKSLQFDERQARRLLRNAPAPDNQRDRDKVLRVGYVSPDFREHSVGHFTRKLIGAHNREKVEVYCYAEVRKPDDFTRHFRAQADQWLSTVGMPDSDLAERIREDGIDVLVDLAGHTSDNRLLTFARKPAPVQVTWLGYPNTTGMRAMDYRLTDAVADPVGEADRLHTEKLVRLEHGFLCYQSDDRDPQVVPPPCLKTGHVTFGTFNTTKKISADAMRIWARILEAIPGARLLLKSESLKDEVTKSVLLKALVQHGIAAERLDLRASIDDRAGHMGLYNEIDIAVDTFPYNGTTTTCEALWMGVPVLALRGDRHAGRVSASILHYAGMPELIAETKEQYVAMAQSLAGDRDRLASLRSSLRPRMSQSPLMDVDGFTETLENVYREMWIRWCDAQH